LTPTNVIVAVAVAEALGFTRSMDVVKNPVAPSAKYSDVDGIDVGKMVVTSAAVLFVALTSPPPEMVAVLVTEAGAVAATFTVTVTGA
jgi:hypothetical protein